MRNRLQSLFEFELDLEGEYSTSFKNFDTLNRNNHKPLLKENVASGSRNGDQKSISYYLTDFTTNRFSVTVSETSRIHTFRNDCLLVNDEVNPDSEKCA